MLCCRNAVSQTVISTVTSHRLSYTSVPQESYREGQQDPPAMSSSAQQPYPSQPADFNAPPPDYADGEFCLESVCMFA